MPAGAAEHVSIEVELGGEHGFAGPLDLLLAIVRANRYPLDRLPLAEITRQFLAYLDRHRAGVEAGNLEAAAGFFETASWLVLLKSRALLPEAEGYAAPAEELRRALLDHEQMQALGRALGERMEQTGVEAGKRGSVEEGREEAGRDMEVNPTSLPKVPTVHDALLAARNAVAAARAHAAIGPLDPGLSVADATELVEARLAALGSDTGLSTEEWLGEGAAPATRVAVLLSLLELARLGTLLLHQHATFAPVWAR